MRRSPQPVVTFDAGQTLVELDLDFLAQRLGERGLAIPSTALATAAPPAWVLYDRLVKTGVTNAWAGFMTALLESALNGDRSPSQRSQIAGIVEWLWQEQPRHNLWRKPIADMVALARELAAAGAQVAVLSNSEGRLAELLTLVGIADAFAVIVDSGTLGFAKPDPRIFAHTLEALGATGATAIHIGDSWSADIEGALAVGWRAIWYGAGSSTVDDPRVAAACDATATRAALVAWGALPVAS